MPDTAAPFPVARGTHDVTLLPGMANRHGLIAGATGTGKTTTLRVLAENFSAIGVPVFLADVKGDLSGLAKAGGDNQKVLRRAQELGLSGIPPEGFPVTFWDVYGEAGHPVRTTVSEMGPLLLSRILGLNDIQSDVLTILFKIADDEGLLLLDLKDLKAMAQYCGDHAKELKTRYGNIAPASIGSIQRSLLALEQQGGDRLFGEPALNVLDFVRTGASGKGMINILSADRLMQNPRTYAAFLLWLLSELFEHFPEAGDPEKPKLVFFFDEAHLLFADTPTVLEEKIIQVVRLIRSKGIGVYFVTQNPLDIPDPVLGQLGNRFHHALRAFTPKDAKNVKGAAGTLRTNPAFDTAKVITELQTGEVLISVLDGNGSPTVVERAFMYPPRSRFAPLTPEERNAVISESSLRSAYTAVIDRESAYEILKQRAGAQTRAVQVPGTKTPAGAGRSAPRNSTGAGDLLGAARSGAVRSLGGRLGRAVVRGVLGSLIRKF